MHRHVVCKSILAHITLRWLLAPADYPSTFATHTHPAPNPVPKPDQKRKIATVLLHVVEVDVYAEHTLSNVCSTHRASTLWSQTMCWESPIADSDGHSKYLQSWSDCVDTVHLAVSLRNMALSHPAYVHPWGNSLSMS